MTTSNDEMKSGDVRILKVLEGVLELVAKGELPKTKVELFMKLCETKHIVHRKESKFDAYRTEMLKKKMSMTEISAEWKKKQEVDPSLLPEKKREPMSEETKKLRESIKLEHPDWSPQKITGHITAMTNQRIKEMKTELMKGNEVGI